MAFVLLLLFLLNGADGSRIVGGREAAPHSRPYMALLKIRGQLNCGGVLVREDFVLSAAHCKISRPYKVVLGSDARSGKEPTRQEFTSVKFFPHPNFVRGGNDIMLIQLNRRAQLTRAVQLIPLKNDTLSQSSQCITVGWGDVGDNDTYAARLREVNVTTLSQEVCRRRWRNINIVDSMVCGVGPGPSQGFCSGDSGGPLVCDGAAAGVVSFSGRRCGDPKTPDVYTRISFFRDWITSVLNNN